MKLSILYVCVCVHALFDLPLEKGIKMKKLDKNNKLNKNNFRNSEITVVLIEHRAQFPGLTRESSWQL